MSEGALKAARPSVGLTMLLLVGAAAFMAAFFAVNRLAGIGMPVFGLIFLVYWAAILQQDLNSYLPTVLGGLMGIVLAWCLLGGLSPIGGWAGYLAYPIIAAVLFCFMRGHVPLVINNATMLLLTVATIPQLHVVEQLPDAAGSFIVGAGFMGGTTRLVNFLVQRGRSAKPA